MSATAPEVTTVPITVPDDLDTLVATLTGEASLHTGVEGHQGERLYVSERLVISPCAGIFELSSARGAPSAAAIQPSRAWRHAPCRWLARSNRGFARVGFRYRSAQPICGRIDGVIGAPRRARPGRATNCVAASQPGFLR